MSTPARWSDGGFYILRGLMSAQEQIDMVECGRQVAEAAPYVLPRMRDGTPFRCSVTAAGAGLFFSNPARGYHYTRTHPTTHRELPPIPPLALELAQRALAEAGVRPVDFDTMLQNRYDGELGDSLGLHIDEQEADLDAALATLCVGADCEFLVGGLDRDFKPDKTVVSGGDAIVMSGASRLWYHGVRLVMPAIWSPLPRAIREAFLLRKVR